MESEERDRRSSDVSFETIRAQKVNFGRNNFLEVDLLRSNRLERHVGAPAVSLLGFHAVVPPSPSEASACRTEGRATDRFDINLLGQSRGTDCVSPVVHRSIK